MEGKGLFDCKKEGKGCISEFRRPAVLPLTTKGVNVTNETLKCTRGKAVEVPFSAKLPGSKQALKRFPALDDPEQYHNDCNN